MRSWARVLGRDRDVAACGSVCVFCGSNFGARDSYSEAAKLAGAPLPAAARLVYGGAKVGLMGGAGGCGAGAGGEVVGVIPEALVAREVAHAG
jgi:predicted Rossmann-fold nucleotide-binding protein